MVPEGEPITARENWQLTATTRSESSCLQPQTGSRGSKLEAGEAINPQSPAPSDIFPLVRLHLLEVPNFSQTAPPSGDQVLEYMSLWGTFLNHHRLPVWKSWLGRGSKDISVSSKPMTFIWLSFSLMWDSGSSGSGSSKEGWLLPPQPSQPKEGKDGWQHIPLVSGPGCHTADSALNWFSYVSQSNLHGICPASISVGCRHANSFLH